MCSATQPIRINCQRGYHRTSTMSALLWAILTVPGHNSNRVFHLLQSTEIEHIANLHLNLGWNEKEKIHQPVSILRHLVARLLFASSLSALIFGRTAYRLETFCSVAVQIGALADQQLV